MNSRLLGEIEVINNSKTQMEVRLDTLEQKLETVQAAADIDLTYYRDLTSMKSPTFRWGMNLIRK